LSAIPALPPPQARNKAGLTGMGIEVSTALSLPMHALRGQEVQSKVSDLDVIKAVDLQLPKVLENAAWRLQSAHSPCRIGGSWMGNISASEVVRDATGRLGAVQTSPQSI